MNRSLASDVLSSRRHQAFPLLSEGDIARMQRFGTLQAYPAGTRIVGAGERGPGLFVVVTGLVAVLQRGGMGNQTPVVEHGPGNFSGELATMTGNLPGRRRGPERCRGVAAGPGHGTARGAGEDQRGFGPLEQEPGHSADGTRGSALGGQSPKSPPARKNALEA
jgi:hypothetical protein